MYEDNLEYSKQRLEGTVIRLITGEAVFVQSVSKSQKGLVFEVQKLLSEETVKVSSDKLLFESPPLGYVNTEAGGCVYVSRVPRRNDWRQGVRKENTISFVNEGDKNKPFMNYKDYGKTIENVYPKYREAIKNVSLNVPVIAFCRDFAVGIGGKLFYKSFEVGTIDRLFERFQYLREYFEEVKGA